MKSNKIKQFSLQDGQRLEDLKPEKQFGLILSDLWPELIEQEKQICVRLITLNLNRFPTVKEVKRTDLSTFAQYIQETKENDANSPLRLRLLTIIESKIEKLNYKK
jgi:hypothetical protein